MAVNRSGTEIDPAGGTNQSTFTYDLTVPSDADFMAIWLHGNRNTSGIITSFAWNGTQMTDEGDTGGANHLWVYTLELPDAGAHQLVVQFSAAISAFRALAAYTKGGVPGSMVGDTSIVTGASTTVTPTNSGDLVLAAQTDKDSGSPSISGGDLTAWANGATYALGYKKNPPASAVTCSFAGADRIGALVVHGKAVGNQAFIIM